VGLLLPARVLERYIHLSITLGSFILTSHITVARFADEVKAERVICLTATATPNVAKDICKAFRVKDSCVFKTSVYRPKCVMPPYPAPGLFRRY
jgi:hypothetical protein